jgi:hypothetical protein
LRVLRRKFGLSESSGRYDASGRGELVVCGGGKWAEASREDDSIKTSGGNSTFATWSEFGVAERLRRGSGDGGREAKAIGDEAPLVSREAFSINPGSAGACVRVEDRSLLSMFTLCCRWY